MSDQRQQAAARNRRLMPGTAAIVDAFRQVFGPGVRLRWARENGIEVGTRSPRRRMETECAA